MDKFIKYCINGNLELAKELYSLDIHDYEYVFRKYCITWHLEVAQLLYSLCEQCKRNINDKLQNAFL